MKNLFFKCPKCQPNPLILFDLFSYQEHDGPKFDTVMPEGGDAKIDQRRGALYSDVSFSDPILAKLTEHNFNRTQSNPINQTHKRITGQSNPGSNAINGL